MKLILFSRGKLGVYKVVKESDFTHFTDIWLDAMDNEEEILLGLLGKEWYEIMFGNNMLEETKWKEPRPTHCTTPHTFAHSLTVLFKN